MSQHTQFPRGQGLPGGVWASNTPILMRDLGAGYEFTRAESAGKAGLTTGLGLPVPVRGGKTYVLTLLSARGRRSPGGSRSGTRAARVGSANEALLLGGLCAREGALWDALADDQSARRVAAWHGPIGRVLGSSLPLVKSWSPDTTAGYQSMVALPVHRGGELAHVVAWYR